MDARHEKQRVKFRQKQMLVTFLRAISIGDLAYKDSELTMMFFELLEALVDVPDDERWDAIKSGFEACLDQAREKPGFEYPCEHAFECIVISSAKVLAEKMSGVAVQHTRAESAVSEAIRYYDRERAEMRRKHRVS